MLGYATTGVEVSSYSDMVQARGDTLYIRLNSQFDLIHLDRGTLVICPCCPPNCCWLCLGLYHNTTIAGAMKRRPVPAVKITLCEVARSSRATAYRRGIADVGNIWDPVRSTVWPPRTADQPQHGQRASLRSQYCSARGRAAQVICQGSAAVNGGRCALQPATYICRGCKCRGSPARDAFRLGCTAGRGGTGHSHGMR